VKEIENAGGKARFTAADLRNADEARRLAAEAGRVDILINNAGIYKFSATTDTDDAFFDEHINVNLRAPYILVQHLVPAMAARGNGAVVNLSTVAASVPGRDAAIYGATKAGVEQLTRVRPPRGTRERGGPRTHKDPRNRPHRRPHRWSRDTHHARARRGSR
jgi:NAD(P)-dependent dehydrogenase (short-subunit alcohol dehydrogenase family)